MAQRPARPVQLALPGFAPPAAAPARAPAVLRDAAGRGGSFGRLNCLCNRCAGLPLPAPPAWLPRSHRPAWFSSAARVQRAFHLSAEVRAGQALSWGVRAPWSLKP